MLRMTLGALSLALISSSFAGSQDYGKHPARNLATPLEAGKPLCCATNLRAVAERLMVRWAHPKDPRQHIQVVSPEPTLWACCIDGQVTKAKSVPPKLVYGKDPRQYLQSRSPRASQVCCP